MSSQRSWGVEGVSGHTPVGNVPEAADVAAQDQVLVQPASAEMSVSLAITEIGRPPIVAAATRPRSAVLERMLSRQIGLPDVATASYGVPIVPESILQGSDERTPIADSTVFPWNAHCSLLITARDGSLYVGTGWLIGPRTVVTAGHCVFINGESPSQNGWVQKIDVMPGRNGSELPFGAFTSSDFRTVAEWANNADPNFDYGAIILSDPVPAEIDFLGFASLPDAQLLGALATVSGYPGDKPDGTQWCDKKSIVLLNPLKVFYEADTMGGQSGTAVICDRGGQPIAVAIHAYGGISSNSGTRINQAVFANLQSWKV